MDLIIGGAYNGKLQYTLKTYNLSINDLKDAGSCSLQDAFNLKGVYNLHKLIKNIIDQGSYKSDFHMDILNNILLSNMEVIICDEVGSGIIPAEENDRLMREYTGRLLAELSNRCEKVIRLYYGIPVIIKG